MNLLKRILKFITRTAVETPIVGAAIFKVADKLDQFEESTELKERIKNTPGTVQISEKSLLGEGVKALKRQMKANMHLFAGGRRYEEGLNLLGYTPGQKENLANARVKTTDLSNKDIKNSKEWDQMIETRIGHYQQLQYDKLKRELIRKIRNEDDASKIREMKIEFEEKYGRRR